MLKRIIIAGFLVHAVVSAFAADMDRDRDSLIEKGHYKQARVVLEKVLAADPNDATAMLQMAMVHLGFREVQPATKLAERAVQLKPKDAQAHAVLADCYGQAADGAGMFQAMSLSRSMRKELDAALAIDPKNYEALHTYMQFYLEAPGYGGGSKRKAQEMADRIASVYPFKGALARIEIALHENQKEHLPELYQKAVEADPKEYEGLIGIASIYAAKDWRDLAKAAEYARRAIKIDPGRGLGYGILAQVEVLNEQWNELDQLMTEAERSAPDNFVYYYRAARALLITGKDHSRAEQYFRKYLSQAPESGMPSLANARWQLGLVLEKQGRKQEAIKEVESALQMDPHLKSAKEDLKRIKGGN